MMNLNLVKDLGPNHTTNPPVTVSVINLSDVIINQRSGLKGKNNHVELSCHWKTPSTQLVGSCG